MQGNTLNFYTPLTSGVGLEGQISIFVFIKLSTKTYLTGVCYDLNDTKGELQVLCFVIYMFLSNNPMSGDINSLKLTCSNYISGAKKASPGGHMFYKKTYIGKTGTIFLSETIRSRAFIIGM